MFKIKYLRNIFLVSVFILLTLVSYNFFFVYPSFRELLQKDAENESVRLVTHWITMLNPQKLEMTAANLPKDIHIRSHHLEKDFELESLKIFSPSGETLYSTDAGEIGRINNTSLFKEKISKGISHTHFVKKGEKVHESHIIDTDIVETCVPLMDQSKFLGAFEVFYDVSERKKGLDKLVMRSSVLEFLIVLGLFFIVFVVLTKAKKTIAKQKEVENSLALSENRYRALVDNAKDVIFTLSKDGLLTSLNPVFETITGWPRNDWLDKHFLPLVNPADREEAMKKFTRVLSGESLPIFELGILSKSGQYKIMEFSVTAKFSNDNQIIGVMGVARDITEMRETKHFIQDILHSVNEGFLVIDPEYKIVTANRAFCNMVKMELSDIIGKHCYEISHASDKPCYKYGEKCTVQETFKTGQSCSALHTHYDRQDNITYIDTSAYPMKDVNGKVTSVIETYKDITEKKNLELQLQHLQKMEAVGTLAGGVAHDFNNILNVIIGFGEIMQMNMPKDDPLSAHLKEILVAANKATNLTQRLLAFSRKQILNPKPVDLNELVNGAKKMFSRLIGEDIQLQIQLYDNALTVMADSGQIEQVLMNLVVNARDAMPEGGSLSISTEKVATNGYTLVGDNSKEIKDYALISVVDSGTGIDKAIREKIFEPFFTTKGMGKGTGLGLAMAYGIVKQHEGYVTVRSESGKGTTFDIYLPIVEQGAEKTAAKTFGRIQHGTETILVVEDDRQSRHVLANTLEEFEYKVIEASDGAEAVEKFIKHQDTVDLIIMDVIMPNMNGKEAYESIKKIKPDIKTLFISGYTDDIIHERGILDEGLHFISKPVRPETLLKKIREMFDSPA